MMFYDRCGCLMSVLGTTKHSRAIVLTLGNEVILYCIYSQSFQHPPGHTINKQADRHVNTQRLEMGMRGRRGWDKMEESSGVNGRQLCVRVDLNLDRERVLLLQCFSI